MLQGKQTWLFRNKPVLTAEATIVGPDEGQGPLKDRFDVVHPDLMLDQDSWEKAEKLMMEQAAQLVLKRSGLQKEQIQFYIGGDLLNQIISNSFAVRKLSIPYIGVFGACSTSMESLALASMIVDSGGAHHVMAGTCSHNCTAEKQFRYPTEYGSQKPPTAQYTVTGAGAAIVSATGEGPVITAATIGKVVDMGIKDPFNMGAAMAPAAADTIAMHFKDTQREPGYYDLIVTGDLASVGYAINLDLLKQKEVDISQTEYNDCGLMIFDMEKQKQLVQAGGSGCACSAVVTYGHLIKLMRAGELRRILVVATGALMSPISFQQGESIPSIAHAVAIENGVN
ncbi:stage V sporulation protein AD [Paenibacillus sp. y28]|uniref:stage V sporulation protein AD n=1 Tax=Paenibacillus sp. y28 TaxID=3129110 RepID=UPI0030183BEE